MLNRRKRLSYTIGCALLIIILCAAGGIGGLSLFQRATSCINGRGPLREFDVTINVGDQNQLKEAFRKFASKNHFLIWTEDYTPNGQEFVMDLPRWDTEVISSNLALDPNEAHPLDELPFYVAFYNNNCFHPTVASDVNGLVSDLKTYISQVPTATITDVK